MFSNIYILLNDVFLDLLQELECNLLFGVDCHSVKLDIFTPLLDSYLYQDYNLAEKSVERQIDQLKERIL